MNRFDCLDLKYIRSEISSLCFIDEAKKIIEEEEVIFNPLVIRKKIGETNEAFDLLKKECNVSFDGIESIETILEKADKNITLTGFELLKVWTLYNHTERIRKQFQLFDGSLSLRDYSDAIMLNNELKTAIEKAIDPSGNVKDDATNELKRIINELSINEARLVDKANSFLSKNLSSLQETAIFTRNNRICFLIRNADKNHFGGYSYGSSASGQAQYIEPAHFVELNNTKARLEEEKEDEIFAILSSLTYLVKKYREDLSNNYLCVLKLCVIFAKARYGLNHGGILASLSNEHLFIKEIAHPLIDPEKVVRNTYALKEPYKGIVISGSNTGGKTVSLKLIGLSVILSYLGIPLIAEKAEIPFFSNVYVDIEDNQSITSSLSTFSAHVSNINSIIENCDEHSLVLIDELISGTDPKEAQAISLAIIGKIEDIGCRFVITTHFDDIKNHAYEDPLIMLSSVGFDMDKLVPTYHYYENSIGSSNALEIARRYFSDEGIIFKAKEILTVSQSEKDELINELARQNELTIKLNEQLKEEKKKAELLTKEYERKLSDFEKDKEKLRQEYIDCLNEEIEKRRKEAEELLSSMKNPLENRKEKIRKLDSLALEERKEEKPFEVGDTVRIKDNESIGKITSIHNDQVTVEFNGLLVRTKTKDLSHVTSHVTKKQYRERKRNTVNKVSHELNLVGKRVEEAMNELEVYLDNAYSLNYTSVRIIHGMGTGALRKAVHAKLSKMKNVASYKLCDYDSGGSAITNVEFRK